MISSIKKINYKSFDDLVLDDIEFKQINLVFGYNGQGKSSFADFLSQNINENTLENFIHSPTKYKIYVYNEKYKRNILYIDDDTQNISSFYAGENIKDLIKSKNKIEHKINKIERFERDNEKKKSEIDKDIDALKTNIAKDIRKVLEKIKPQAYKTPQSYTKNKITDEKFVNARLLNDDEFNEISSYKADNSPQTINLLSFSQLNQILPNLAELKKILQQTPQNKAIDKFKNDAELENFAKIALNIKNKNMEYKEKCPLCEQSIAAIRLWEKLEQHFNKEYENFIERLNQAKNFYKQASAKLLELRNWLDSNFIQKKLLLKEEIDIDALRQEIIKSIENLTSRLNTIIQNIETKIQTPNQSINFEIELKNISESLKFDEIENLVKEHNERRGNYDKIIDEGILKIQEHFMAKNKDDFIKLCKNRDKVRNFIEKISSYKEKIKEQIKCLENQLKEKDKSFEALNKDLNEWFFKDIQFEKIADSHYKIQRKNCKGEWFDCKSGLSEGEKTIISLVYFSNSYLSALNNLQECPILIIDDPITSLDSNNKEKIANYIFNKIINNPRGQIFILSHDASTLKKIDKQLQSKQLDRALIKIYKANLSSKISILHKIPFNGTRQMYERLKAYIDNPSMNEGDIMHLPRKLLEEMFHLCYGEFAERGNFTQCYHRFLKEREIAEKYKASDIHEINHRADEDLSPEFLEKCKFVVEMFENFIGENASSQT